MDVRSQMDVEGFETALLSLDRLGAWQLMLDAGFADRPAEVLDGMVAPALVRIGEAWEGGQVALSQIYMSSRICQKIMVASTAGVGSQHLGQPRIGVAVLDDVHSLGKTIVLSMLQGSGYEVQDLGSHRGVDELVAMVERDAIEVLMISVLMLRAALQVTELRAHLDAAGLDTKLVVGGAPFRFDERLWREVGADYVGHNAADALQALSAIESKR